MSGMGTDRIGGGVPGMSLPHISFAAKTQRTEVPLLRESEVQKVLKFNVSDWKSDSNSIYQNMSIK
jgi:hypothetical protein